MHEAFAETITFNPRPGMVVTKAPPPAIEEVPPDEKPEGAHVDWIPGYWAWDADGNDFIWVSGVWRAVPPGREWVPGYWTKVADGYQWISGYWADDKDDEIDYLPPPPETLEVGPSVEPPSPDDAWLPGCWVWVGGHYAWRPGYWAPERPDWIWVPAHYLWTPRGYVFSDGYWDYSVNRRGVLFAPVQFAASVYGRAGFEFSPSVVIDLDAFHDHLFVRSHDYHYYFGDYYAPTYEEAGFHLAFLFHRKHGYDPIFAQQRWEHRSDHSWEQHVASEYERRRDHPDARPPRTLVAQNALARNEPTAKDRSRVLAVPLLQLSKNKDSPVHFQPLAKDERHKLAQHEADLQKYRDERRTRELPAAVKPGEKPAQPIKPERVKLPKSPIMARPADQLGKEHVPPKPHLPPKPEPKEEPKPKRE